MFCFFQLSNKQIKCLGIIKSQLTWFVCRRRQLSNFMLGTWPVPYRWPRLDTLSTTQIVCKFDFFQVTFWWPKWSRFRPKKKGKSQFTAFLPFAAEEGQLRRMKGVDTVLKKAAAAWTSAWIIVLKEKKHSTWNTRWLRLRTETCGWVFPSAFLEFG